MANQDQIGRAFKLRTTNQKIIDLQEPWVLNIPAGNLLVDDSQSRRTPLSGEANLTLTNALSGSLILMDDATQAFVLPEITAANVGIWFEFVSTVAATATTITANAADLYIGSSRISSTTAGGDDSFHPDVSNDVIFTMNGTTQGGEVGSYVYLHAISATRWLIRAELVGSGTLISNFT